MSRQEYYSYSNTYEYNIEIPYDGAISDGVEGATILDGEVTWSADITWNGTLGQYEVYWNWTDYSNQFSEFGNGPKEDDFIADLYSYLSGQGIDSEEIA